MMFKLPFLPIGIDVFKFGVIIISAIIYSVLMAILDDKFGRYSKWY